MAKKESLIDQLSKFGLTAIEAKVYLYLLNREAQTVYEISNVLQLPKTSVYDNIEKLFGRGLLEKVLTYKSQKFKAYPLTILESFLDKEEVKLKMLRKDLHSLKNTITQTLLVGTNTEVRYYHGIQGMKQMLWNTLNADRETVGYSESGRIDIVGKKFKLDWAREVIKRQIKDRVIINPNQATLRYHLSPPEAEFRNQFQTVRYLDKNDLYITGDITIYNNIFAVCYWRQGEVVGAEIENPQLVKTQKSIFEILWKIAKPLA